MDVSTLKEMLGKLLTPGSRRSAVNWAITERSGSQRRAWPLVGLDRKTYRYASRRSADDAIRKRLREPASERRRFGYRRLRVLLRREGIEVNHKKLSGSIAKNGSPCANAAVASGRWVRGRRWQSRRVRTSAGRWTSCRTPSSMAGGFGFCA